MSNKSPLRYVGGKTRLCKHLHDILITYYDPRLYSALVSPFFGGGSFELFLQNLYAIPIIANDLFRPLYNFWNICKHDNNALCTELYKYVGKVSKEQFLDFKERILTEEDPLKQACMYFIINRCSFSGSTLSGGFSPESACKRYTTSAVDRVSKMDMTKISLYNYDFEEFIRRIYSAERTDLQTTARVPSEKYLFFLDPPYCLDAGKDKLYGSKGNMHEGFDHERLRECISNKEDWIMTYNDCAYIRNLYKGYPIITLTGKYCMRRSERSSEIIIIGKPSI